METAEFQNKYYFHYTGKLNQSYILETPERQPVFNANCDHMGILTPYRFTFKNHITGKEEQHKVSHTVTNSVGDGSFSVNTNSYFKIDGVNIWDVLNSMGYTFTPKRTGLKMNYDVFHDGVKVAYLEAAGTNILRDDKQTALGDKIVGTGLFKVYCNNTDIDGVFMVCFCLSRVEFF